MKKHVFCTVFITVPLPKLDFTFLQSKNTSIHPTLTSGTLCIPWPVRTHSTLPLWWLATAKWSHLPALKSGYWQRLDECKEHKAFLQLHWAGKRWTTYTRVFKNKADVDVSSRSVFINKKFAKKCPIKLHVKVNILHIQEQSSQYTTRFLTYNNLCNNSLQFPRAEFSFSTLSQLENIWAKTKWEIYHFVGFRKKRGIRWKGLSSLLDFLISPFSFFHSEHIPVLTVHVADNINRK